MSKTVRNTKSSESMTKLNVKPILSRSDPSMKTSALHPWYYVKGRKDLTEKNISSRREREDQKYRQSVCDNQYFNKRLAESEVFHKWIDNKSLVRHPKQQTNDYSLRPPFDVSVETKANSRNVRLNKELEKKYSKSKQKLTQFMTKFSELNAKYSELEKRQNRLIFQLNELKKTEISVEEKRDFCRLSHKCLPQMRLSRDKLRKKVFLIVDQLEFYKSSVQRIRHLHKSPSVLNREEMIQMSEVLDRAIKILQMYIDLNQSRNNEFGVMFDEEGEQRWESQEEEWQVEDQVWNAMIDKLIDSYRNVLKDKLSQLLAEEKESLDEREQQLKELTEFTAKIKSNPQLSVVLSENVIDLMTEITKN